MNVVAPGMIDTPAMQAYLQRNAGAEEVLTQMTPLGRLGHAEEIAGAVLFLASNESRLVAGVELFVDGGVMAV